MGSEMCIRDSSCLQAFSRADVLEQHSRCCLMHAPQQTVYPNADDARSCKLSFRAHYQEFRFFIYLAADFERFLSPWSDGNDDAGDAGKQARGTERIIDVHRLSGFCVHRVSRFEEFQTKPYTYSGENPIDVFYDHVLSESRIISDMLATCRCIRSRRPSKRRTMR